MTTPASASSGGGAAPARSYPQLTLPGSSNSAIAAAVQSRARETSPPFADFQSTLATQEYIQATIKHDPSDVGSIISCPVDHDPAVWMYECLRQILLELNGFVAALGEVCSAESCPKMQATEQWEFMCAAHGGSKPKACCAIDYILHTLCSFTVLMTDAATFPNRYTISDKSAQQFGNICRRLYRVFAHAAYHHRETFEEIESRSHLTRRFIQFALQFELMTAAMLVPTIEL